MKTKETITFFMRFYGVEKARIDECLNHMRLACGHRFAYRLEPMAKSMNVIVPPNSTEAVLIFKSKRDRQALMDDAEVKATYEAYSSSYKTTETVTRHPGDMAYEH